MEENMDALSLLIKPASGNCNMRCRYCFYADVTDSREVKNRGMMTLDTLEILVKKAFEEATHFVSFGFQGGEPTLAGLDFYKALMEFQRTYNIRRIPVSNSIQTNGSLIDTDWAEFFAENQFLTGLSIDGTKEIHDRLRPDAQRKGTYLRCMKAADTLTKAGADFNILTVVTRDFARHPDKAYNFYKKNNLRYIQLIPCLDGLEEAHGSSPYSLSAELYGDFLCRFFDLWYEDFIRGDYYSVRMFDNYIRIPMGEPPENCGMRGHCSAYPVIEADGSVYPCDFYVIDEYLLGYVQKDSFTDMLQGTTAARFITPSETVHEDCLTCPYGFLCRGGCRRDRETMPDGSLSVNYYCEGYKKFFAHTKDRIMDIARKMLQDLPT